MRIWRLPKVEALGRSLFQGSDKRPLIRAIRYTEANYQMPRTVKFPMNKLRFSRMGQIRSLLAQDGRRRFDCNSPSAQRIEQIRDSHWAYRPIGQFEPPRFRMNRGPPVQLIVLF